jgi:uncharacterized cupredoxin-like copper-binding protein
MFVTAALCLAATVLLAACGGPGAPEGQSVTVQGLDTLRFSPEALTATVGQTVNVTLESSGALEHAFIIDEFSVNIGPVPGGQSGNGSFTPAQAGTFTYYCNVPGHREAGMEGTLTVNS